MKIDALRIKNFRCHRELLLEGLSPVVVVCGENATGKSSVSMAIEWLLSGGVDGPNRQAIPPASLLRHGAEEMSVEALVAGVGHIGRKWSAKGSGLSVEGFPGTLPIQAGQKALMKALGLSESAIDAAMASRWLLTMPGKEQRTCLLQVYAAKPVALDDPGLRALAERASVKLPRQIADADELQAFHKAFFDARRDANRDAAAAEAAAKSAAQALPEAANRTEADIRNEVASVDGAIVRLERQIEKEIQAASQAAGRRKEVEDRIEVMRERVIENEEELRNLVALAGRQEEVDEATAALEEANRTLGALRMSEPDPASADDATIRKQLVTQAENVKRRMEAKQAEAAGLHGVKGSRCPTCGRALPKEQKKELCESAIAEAREASKELETIKADIGEIDERARAALEAAIRNKVEDRNRLRSKLEQLAEVSTAVARYGEHTAATDAIRRAKERLASLEEPAGDGSTGSDGVTALRNQLSEAREVRATLGAALGRIEAYRRAKEHAQSMADSLAGATEKATALDKLVQYFGPKGPLSAALVGDRLPQFVREVDRAMGMWGYAFGLRLDPFDMAVGKRTAGRGTDVSVISASEAWRASAAIHASLSSATGLRLALLDGGDILHGGETRGRLSEWLSDAAVGASKTLDQVFLFSAGVLSDEAKAAAEEAGVTVIALGED